MDKICTVDKRSMDLVVAGVSREPGSWAQDGGTKRQDGSRWRDQLSNDQGQWGWVV